MRTFFISVLAFAAFAAAQAPPAPVARFAATTSNLKAGPNSVRIDILAWSTDAARSRLVDAWNLIAPAPVATRGAGGRGARGGTAPATAAGATEGAATTAPPAAAAGRGGRGGGRGAAPAGLPSGNSPARDTPEGSLAAALQSAEGVGYLWTSESTGYSIRYAYRLPQPDGGERIILATDRRLGAFDDSWKPAAGQGADYGFSIIELRLNAKHEGEGKTSLIGKVAIDSSANTIGLDSYAALPITLKDVKPK